MLTLAEIFTKTKNKRTFSAKHQKEHDLWAAFRSKPSRWHSASASQHLEDLSATDVRRNPTCAHQLFDMSDHIKFLCRSADWRRHLASTLICVTWLASQRSLQTRQSASPHAQAVLKGQAWLHCNHEEHRRPVGNPCASHVYLKEQLPSEGVRSHFFPSPSHVLLGFPLERVFYISIQALIKEMLYSQSLRKLLGAVLLFYVKWHIWKPNEFIVLMLKPFISFLFSPYQVTVTLRKTLDVICISILTHTLREVTQNSSFVEIDICKKHTQKAFTVVKKIN